MNNLEKEFVPYQESIELKELGFNEPCFSYYELDGMLSETPKESGDDIKYPGDCKFDKHQNEYLNEDEACSAPTFSQAINFLYICSNKQIDIELKASDTYEERIRKITKGCEDLRNLQNNKSN